MPLPSSGLVIGGLCIAYTLLRTSSRSDAPVEAPQKKARKRPALSAMPPPDEDEDEDLARIDELLFDLIKLSPSTGILYPIHKGDTMSNVIKRALDTVGPSTDRMRQEYAWGVVSGAYNRDTYGTPSTSKSYPSTYLAPGVGSGIRVAFLQRNEDAIVAMRSGQMPQMTVDPRTGAPQVKEERSRGLIWLPPVDADRFAEGIVTCESFMWENGASTIDIDPELRSYLEAA